MFDSYVKNAVPLGLAKSGSAHCAIYCAMYRNANTNLLRLSDLLTDKFALAALADMSLYNKLNTAIVHTYMLCLLSPSNYRKNHIIRTTKYTKDSVCGSYNAVLSWKCW